MATPLAGASPTGKRLTIIGGLRGVPATHHPKEDVTPCHGVHTPRESNASNRTEREKKQCQTRQTRRIYTVRTIRAMGGRRPVGHRPAARPDGIPARIHNAERRGHQFRRHDVRFGHERRGGGDSQVRTSRRQRAGIPSQNLSRENGQSGSDGNQGDAHRRAVQ